MKASLVLSLALLCATVPAVKAQGMKDGGMNRMGSQSMMSGKAIAVLTAVADAKVSGTVRFEQTAGGLRIVADVDGLTPGKHGFHVHEFGDCSAADFTSTGGHFAAPGEKHGAPGDPTSHLGDLGNLDADASGHAHYEWLAPRLSLMGPDSVLGRAVIIHAGEDDLSTQPTGGAGGRVACGVIGRAKP